MASRISAFWKNIRSALSNLANPSTWFVDSLGGSQASSGVLVNEETAMRSTAVYASVRLLSETMASLPLIVYRRLTGGGKERATDHPLYLVLHDQVNPYMTSMVFRETLMAHLLLWGNAYAEIEYDKKGNIVALWPLLPDRTYPRMDAVTSELYYYTTVASGQEIKLPSWKVLHIPGLGFNGLVGRSPIRMAREAIGLSLATEEFGSRFFGQGAKPGGVLEHPGKLSDDSMRRLRASWAEIHSGLHNSHRIAILEEGMKYQQIGIPPEDAQFLETRRFQVNEIARIFRVPPHMIGDLDRATFSNIEQQSLEFVVYSLRPWLVRWEQAINAKLLMPEQRQIYFVEHLVDGLLRGDIQSRYQAYAVARQNGWLSADDIRELENMNPLPDGQGNIYLVNGNMIPVGSVDQVAQLSQTRTETRSEKQVEKRRKYYQSVAKSYRSVFEDAAKRVLKREMTEIIQKAEKMIGQRDVQLFMIWLQDFYSSQNTGFISEEMDSVFRSYADMIAAIAAEEVGGEVNQTTLSDFVRGYIAVFIQRYAGESLGILQKRIEEAITLKADIVETVKDQFDKWFESRPSDVAKNETVRTRNAVKRQTWVENGVKALRWVTVGKNCPHCNSMNGKIIGINNYFLAKGETVHPEGHDPMTVGSNIHHPPLHRSCNCDIEPVTE